jgi:pectinesterase
MRLLCSSFLILAGYGTLIAEAKTITVAPDGSGDFKTIQEAIATVPKQSADRTIIHIKPGTYQGAIIVPADAQKVTFQGDDAETTILTWDRNVQDPVPQGSDRVNPGVQVIGDDFHADNITIQNTSGNHGQAIALRMDGDREVMTHCRLIGWQDTLMINNGREYWKNCYIAGRVDFIYGSATAFFDHCEVHSRNGGHVTAASTPQDHPFGYVFYECKLTGDATPWVRPATDATTKPTPDKLTPKADLGRPWRPYAAVVYIHCEMGDHIKPEGWQKWIGNDNDKTARYSEYQSTGPGANPDKRLPWTHQLTADEAARYTIANVLGATDGWDPAADLVGK